VETIVGLLLVTLLTLALVESVGLSRRLTYANALRLAAFGMCKSRLEQVRALGFDQLNPTNFPAETAIRFAHLSGRSRLPLTCNRSVSFSPQVDPERTDVQVTVTWNYGGLTLQEHILGSVYPK